MSNAAAHLLQEFARLSPDEQREFAALILRRVDFGDITDQELTASAAQVFAMLDEEEDAATR